VRDLLVGDAAGFRRRTLLIRRHSRTVSSQGDVIGARCPATPRPCEAARCARESLCVVLS